MAVYRLFGFSVLTACVYGFSLWSTRHPSFSSSRLLTWATKGRLTGNNHGMKAEKSAAEIGFTDMFHDCLEEEEGKDLEVIGEIPPSVSGILVRNGPALFGSLAENGKRYGHIFDGLAKLARFSIKDGKVNFSTKFIRSKWHQKMIGERSDIPPSITTGPVKPPFSTSEKIRAALTASSTFDNVPVNVHQIGGKPDGPWVATTDAPVMMEFDINSLETKGRKKVSPKLTSIGGVELFSTAHPCVRNGKSYNYLLEYKPLSGKNQAHIISIDAQGDRKIVGTVELEPWEIPYIHMISVTENFAVLCIWPLQISMSKMINGDGFMPQLEWTGNRVNTRIHVFHLTPHDEGNKSGDFYIGNEPPLTPSFSFEAPPLFAYHHVNCFEEVAVDGQETIVLDVTGYKSGKIANGAHAFAYIENMEDESLRLKQERDGEFYRFRLPITTAVSATERPLGVPFVEPTYLPARSLSGKEYTCELVTVAPKKKSRKYRYAYGFTGFAGPEEDLLGPAGGFLKWALVKTNLDVADSIACGTADDSAYSATIWEEPNCYPSEPTFVSSGKAGAEDDGVLLSQVYDGTRRETFLLILDAMEMKEIARCYTGMKIPVPFHGQFFDLRVDEDKVAEPIPSILE